MGMFDDAKGLLGKAEELAGEHPDQVKQAIDKAEQLLDERTGEKYTSQIDGAGAKAESFVQGLGRKDPQP